MASPVGVYVEGIETGNGFALIEFAGISSQAPKGQNTFIKMNIQPATKRLTYVNLKARLLNNTALADFSQTPSVQPDTTFRINIPAGATETAFFLQPTAETITEKGVEFTITGTGAGLGLGSQIVHRVDFTEITALSNFDVENTVLYPVPAQTEIFVRTPLQNYEVSLIDISGRVVKKFSHSPRTINLSDLANGVYYVNFKNAQGNIVKKIIVSK